MRYSKIILGPSEVWARPVEMFAEKVDVDGRKTDRFTFIG